MDLVRNFTKLSSRDVSQAGGKGASLGEMTQAGILVPPGFVILADAFERFIAETDLNIEIDAILDSVNHKEMHTIENASEKIQGLILNAMMPLDIVQEIKKSFEELRTEFVAVRSSATAEDSSTAAWAGQLDSFLNTTESTLLKNVQRCWASLFTPRAIFYRFEKDLHKQKISVAVVVQKMVASEESGIAFSAHPVTQDYNQLIIEAGFGLGEAIVSGQITPDSYVVKKEPSRIIDVNVNVQARALYRSEKGGNEWRDLSRERGESQVLSAEQILEFSEILLHIEKHYGFPVDVEWAREAGIFYIVQSRPITTLTNSDARRIAGPKSQIKSEEYTRLFYLENVGRMTLFAGVFAGHYARLRALQLIDHGAWTSYIPKKTVEQTLKEGVRIYCDKRAYEDYKNKFKLYMRDSEKAFRKTLNKQILNAKDASDFLTLASQHFYYYSKTEFFYTDKAFIQCKDAVPFKNNAQEFERFKNKGRVYLNKIIFVEGYIDQLLERLSKQLHIVFEDLRAYTVDEVVQAFGSFRLAKQRIVSRAQRLVVTSVQAKPVFVEDDEAASIIQEFSHGMHESTLKGTIASRGVVTGRALVVPPNYMNDFSIIARLDREMKPGDILVAETTSPELMPLCKKAAGIITNQGGQLSHAAIISREMGIPCLIGVGNATLFFHQGDRIQLNADAGIVRGIK